MSTKANCILLKVRGKQYYAEEFGKFIEIEEWEYDRILTNPNLYYFSTALKKHFEWCAAIGEARTLTFSDALGQTHGVIGSPEGKTGSPAEPEQPTFEAANATRKPIAILLSRLRETIEQPAIRLTKSNILLAALAGVAALLFAYDLGAPTYSSADSPVPTPEIRRAIPVEPEIRKAVPVQTKVLRARGQWSVDSGQKAELEARAKRQAIVAVVKVPGNDTLNVRADASADSAIIARLRSGDHVFLRSPCSVNTAKGIPVVWEPITAFNGATGWVNADYLTLSTDDPHAPLPELVRASVVTGSGCRSRFVHAGGKKQPNTVDKEKAMPSTHKGFHSESRAGG